ncbi:hypothetical protein MNBD_GAMMA16-1419 [hydrothermal vent metagenome]|uniref:Uncharacterized protein n=1 Tax=hydrothermal vent metagenome TaxID=652676 RepID=A0A3B0Z2R2_9ZZZZ
MANSGSDLEAEVIEVQPHELMLGLIEVIRETDESIGYYKMKEMTRNHLDDVIEETINKEKQKQNIKLSMAEIHALAGKLYTQLMMRGTIQALSSLSSYYADATRMSRDDLLSEGHSPNRLARYKKATGVKRPLNTAAHAIVSGAHPEAEAARKILAKFKIRVDDPHNGVFLPRSSCYIPHPEMPDAVNHAGVHTKEYYLNVTTILRQTNSALECRMALRLIAVRLQKGTMGY